MGEGGGGKGPNKDPKSYFTLAETNAASLCLDVASLHVSFTSVLQIVYVEEERVMVV